MADVATPSAAAMFDGGATTDKKKIEKPEKPDEAAYKAQLDKAQKDYEDTMARLVSQSPFPKFNSLREQSEELFTINLNIVPSASSSIHI